MILERIVHEAEQSQVEDQKPLLSAGARVWTKVVVGTCIRHPPQPQNPQ